MTEHNPEQTWFKRIAASPSLSRRLKAIRLVIADIDGTLTDNSLYFHPSSSEEFKNYSVLDGFGTKAALKAGLKIAYLSGKTGEMVSKRASLLGIPPELCFLGKDGNKSPYVKELQTITSCSLAQTLMFGDDIPDLETKSIIELFAAPQSSLFYIHTLSDLVVPRNAGYGAFRLLLDLILYVQERHPHQALIAQSF